MQTALDEVMKGRTTFVIAHRLATIRNANRILVFEHGRIVETGTFDELVHIGGHFAELAKTQFMMTETKGASPRQRHRRSLRVSREAISALCGGAHEVRVAAKLRRRAG